MMFKMNYMHPLFLTLPITMSAFDVPAPIVNSSFSHPLLLCLLYFSSMYDDMCISNIHFTMQVQVHHFKVRGGRR